MMLPASAHVPSAVFQSSSKSAFGCVCVAVDCALTTHIRPPIRELNSHVKVDLLKGALTAAQLKEFNIVVFVNAPRAKLEELGKVGVWWLGSGSVWRMPLSTCCS